ncbi:hypothetical protein HAX54_040096, partial [Datura stramonium]|nr:hypothetical protein [Datura stramonium]
WSGQQLGFVGSPFLNSISNNSLSRPVCHRRFSEYYAGCSLPGFILPKGSRFLRRSHRRFKESYCNPLLPTNFVADSGFLFSIGDLPAVHGSTPDGLPMGPPILRSKPHPLLMLTFIDGFAFLVVDLSLFLPH